jgi:hypothetical protein
VVGRAPEVDVAAPDHLRRRRVEDVRQLGVGLAEHERGPRLDDARLLLGDAAAPVVQAVGVVERDVRQHRHRAVGDVGGVPAAQEPHLDDGGRDRLVREPAEGRRGQQLEVRRGLVEQRLEAGQVAQHPGQVAVGDRLAVAGDPLVDRLEVGAREGADREVVGAQQRRDHAGHRALAVRPGDVHDGLVVLRVAQHLAQAAHRVELQALHAAGQDR